MKIIARRDEEHGGTTAIITCKDTPKLPDNNAFLAALMRAITKWVKNTEEGREAWTDSCRDFNVGDLAMIASDTLKAHLAEEGIEEMEIDLGGGEADFGFDKILVNRDELIDEEE